MADNDFDERKTAEQIVDLIRSPKVTRAEGIKLVRQAFRAARSGGEVDAARAAWDGALKAFDTAAGKLLAGPTPEQEQYLDGIAKTVDYDPTTVVGGPR